MGVAAGPLSRDRRVAALLGALAGTNPVALAEADLESRTSTDPPRAVLPSANDLNGMVRPCAAKRVELEMKIMRCRQLVDRTADEEYLRRIRNQIAELEQSLREIDCLWPMNLIAPPQTDNCRGIALSGFNTAPPSIIRLGGAVCISSLI